MLIDQGLVTPIGNPNWSAFADQLVDVRYESFRKAVTNERWPSPKIMEAVAAALGIEPAVFWEYQLYEAQRAFDPQEVGDDVAYANLQAWLKSRKRVGG
jgi:hypothetical protein